MTAAHILHEKACTIQSIAQAISSEVREHLKAVAFWCLLFEGSENVTKVEQEIVSLSSDKEFTSDYLGLIHFCCELSRTFTISVCTDRAAVRLGVYNGAIPKLNQVMAM